MDHHSAELWLAAIVLVVILAGVVALLGPFRGPTAAVVEGSCVCEPGEPVCAASGARVSTYPSACHASCADARVVFEGRCANIPQI